MSKSLISIGLLLFSTTLLVVLYNVTFSFFTYHPLLILIALVSTTEGIAGIQSKKVIGEQDKTYHAVLQGLGFTALTLGFSVIYYNKDLNSKPHFTTTHGQLGSITFMYMLIQLLAGTIMAYVPSLFGGVASAKRMYKYHRISGYLMFVLLWSTVLYGVQTPFLWISNSLGYIYFISIICLFFGVFSLVQTTKLGSMKASTKMK